jgi:DNA-3-methyladenine glycosylase I
MRDEDLDALLDDAGLIRHKLKLYSIRNNALAALKVQAEFGSLENYFWGFVNGEPLANERRSTDDVPASTELSEALSKDLKKRGFKFIGSTICYAFMQAGGLVDDHVSSCFRHEQDS